MDLRDRFERLGVPEYLLAQILWAEIDESDPSPKQLVDLARRLFPDGIHAQVEKALLAAPQTSDARALQARLWTSKSA